MEKKVFITGISNNFVKCVAKELMPYYEIVVADNDMERMLGLECFLNQEVIKKEVDFNEKHSYRFLEKLIKNPDYQVFINGASDYHYGSQDQFFNTMTILNLVQSFLENRSHNMRYAMNTCFKKKIETLYDVDWANKYILNLAKTMPKELRKKGYNSSLTTVLLGKEENYPYVAREAVAEMFESKKLIKLK